MLETIFSWLGSRIGYLITWIVKTFLPAFDIDVKTFVSIFPAMDTAYDIFQGIGVGLLIILASFALLKFFMPGIGEIKETPVAIAIRTFISAFLIFFGWWILDYIIKLAKIPFNIL